jgi:hypothetical protein
MKRRTRQARSGPIYIRTDPPALSLVEEVRTTEYDLAGFKLSRLAPSSLFVIDAHGVHRRSFRAANLPGLGFALLLALCAPMRYWLLTRRQPRER